MQEPGYMRAPMLAPATFGLRLALRLFEKTNNDVTPTSTVSNPLLHVRPPRAGGIACCRSTTKQKPVLVCEQPCAWATENACSSKIKLLLIVQVDATHQSTTLDKSLFTHFKWATSYVGVDIFCFVCTPFVPKCKSFLEISL